MKKNHFKSIVLSVFLANILSVVQATTETAPATPPSSASQEWDGHEYSRNAILQYEWAKKFFFAHHSLKSDANVLDIGSGNGVNTAKIAALTPQGKVVGIDNSASMVETAKRHYAKVENLSFFRVDATDSHFYDAHRDTFDAVVSLVTLHWITDQSAVLKGIFTALKPNGVAYLRLCSKGGDPIQDIADRLSQAPAWKSYFKDFQDPMNRFSVIEYERLLHSHGFSVVRLDDVEDRDRLDNVMALKQQLKSWLPHYRHLAKHKLALAGAFIAEIIRVYTQEHPIHEDGSVTLIDHYLEVVAQKPGPSGVQ